MLSRNICVEVGLVNGSIGSIIEIVKFDSLEDDDYNKIDDILVRFPIYTGRIFIHDMPDVVHIFRVSLSSKRGERFQFLLYPASAISIHKSQGSSFDNLYCDIGNKEFVSGLTFVALSRCRTFEHLWLRPFPFSRLLEIKNIDPDKVYELHRLFKLKF